MKKLILIVLTLFLTTATVDVNAQKSLLHRLGKAIEQEVKKSEQKTKSKTQQKNEQINEQKTEQESKTGSEAQESSAVAESMTTLDHGVEVYEGPISGTHNNHGWIDLGLPSGTKWATCNVGASKDSQAGNLYAWGETSTKSTCTEANSKLNGKDVGDIAGSEYDVATAKWGKGWRMPTQAEFKELVDYCVWDYESYEGRWVVKLTNLKNGRYIYFPTTGHRDGSKVEYPNGCGNYWTSTPYDNYSAHEYHFGAALGEMGCACRYYGYAVRPVLCTEDVATPTSGKTQGYEWVDLGLPSGTKWATCNIGAKTAFEGGKHFEWGEITPTSDHKSDKNRFADRNDVPNIAGDTRYDAATALWGSSWQIPSEEQFRELLKHTQWEWTTINGKSGYKLTSKKNSNWIFFVANGYHQRGNSRDVYEYVGIIGNYWTSTTDADESMIMKFRDDVKCYIINELRDYGYGIRPVTK